MKNIDRNESFFIYIHYIRFIRLNRADATSLFSDLRFSHRLTQYILSALQKQVKIFFWEIASIFGGFLSYGIGRIKRLNKNDGRKLSEK